MHIDFTPLALLDHVLGGTYEAALFSRRRRLLLHADWQHNRQTRIAAKALRPTVFCKPSRMASFDFHAQTVVGAPWRVSAATADRKVRGA